MGNRAARLASTLVLILSLTLTSLVHPFFPVRSDASVLRVDASSEAPAPDGATWATAYPSLQAALDAASSGDQIWIAGGIYRPGAQAASTFAVPGGVSLYGGFAGDEATLAERDPDAHGTILSGDIGGDDAQIGGVTQSFADIVGTNAHQVVTVSSAAEVVTLDGLIITGGDGLNVAKEGAGLVSTASTVHLADVLFVGNQASKGGALRVQGGSLLAERTLFNGNRANTAGGALYNNGAALSITRSVFAENQGSNGGAVATYDAGTTLLVNVVLWKNSATANGGALYASNSTFTLVNVTVADNQASTLGGGLCAQADTARFHLSNTILWGNTCAGGPQMSAYDTSSTEYSLIQGSGPEWSTTLGSNGGGNLATDPAFANAAAGNLSLTAGSPAIDVGLNTALPEGVLTDLAGRDRVYDGDGDLTATVDMGAYEYGAPAVAGLNVATVNGTQGQEVAVPVQIALDEGEVYGADLVFGYDASRLTATRVEQGALTGAWSLEANLSTPGQVAVSLAGAVPVTASGEFVRLVFRASGALGFAEVALSSADLNENGFTVTSVPGGVTVHSPVAVDFSGDDTAGPAPHTVTFTAQTSGEVETYAWSFGDGTTSGEESPTHVYVNAGTFDVSLTVTGPGGTDTETKLGYIVVHEPAQAAFNAAPVGGLAPLTVAFTNQSTGKVSTYLWDFGDGATSAEANPSHVYAEPGSYDVSLTASGDGGESTSTQEDLITVRLGTISGAVTFWNEDRAIPGVPVALSGSATITATSSMTGAYTLGGLYRGAYAVTPGDRGVYEEAVSPYDASLALKHAAGLITLADEALAAADVTLNNAATAYDASYILRASIESLPYASVLTGADWRYTPASRTYPEYSDDLTAQDYVGLLMGDISGNWGGGPEATGSAGRPVVRLRLTLAAAGAAGHVRATVALVSSDAPAYSLRLALRAPSGTTVAGCSAGEGAPGWMAACHAPAPGEIRLALAGSQAARPGPLAVLDLSLGTDMAIALEPVSAEIDEGAATVRWEAQGDGPHLWFPLMWR